MNFTREPIIETVITPRDGYRLLLRSSKSADREEHSVEAVEIISFGHSFFFRSLERAKPFLLPLSDYELVEHREVRMALHNVPLDRSIKISGGRQPSREVSGESFEDDGSSATPLGEASSSVGARRDGGKRRSRRRRSSRGSGERSSAQSPQASSDSESSGEEGIQERSEVAPAPLPPPPMSRLIPPPTTLIKETLGRYKAVDEFSPPPFPPHNEREEVQKESDIDDDTDHV